MEKASVFAQKHSVKATLLKRSIIVIGHIIKRLYTPHTELCNVLVLIQRMKRVLIDCITKALAFSGISTEPKTKTNNLNIVSFTASLHVISCNNDCVVDLDVAGEFFSQAAVKSAF